MSEQLKFDEEVQMLIHADPFKPFTLIFSSGDKFEVTDPGFFVFGEGVIYLVQQKSGLAIFRKHELIGVEVHQNA
ncbi:MAG TPA: hypothetical protein VFC46_04580 [Humisphaera sp.]|nr:hypothetical protein [Humisphaera sp.]